MQKLLDTTVMIGGEDWSTYLTKYKLRNSCLMSEEDLKTISEFLKEGVSIEFSELKQALQIHLRNRLDDAEENIKDIMSGSTMKTPDDAMKIIQFRCSDIYSFEKEFNEFIPPYSYALFKKWKKEIDNLDMYQDKMQFFDAFSAIEEEFEKTEKIIQEYVIRMESAIEHYIDIKRGK